MNSIHKGQWQQRLTSIFSPVQKEFSFIVNGDIGLNMEHITYTPVVSKERERLKCVKYSAFFLNVVIFMLGCVLLGIGIWMAVDRNFLTVIIGNNLYAASIYIMLSCGALIFVFTVLGCCAVVTEDVCWLAVHLAFLCIIGLSLFVGATLAIVFKTQIGDQVRETMSETLRNYYGVELEYYYNQMVTDGWDKAQERLRCCGVSTEGWRIYESSGWFAQQVWTPENYQPFVPPSCCVKDRFWRYINLEACQKWRIGPPGSSPDGAINRALHYEGCFEASYAYLVENCALVLGLSISVAALVAVGIVLTAILIHRIRNMKSKRGATAK